MRNLFQSVSRRAIDPEGQRFLGLTLEGGDPVFAPKGHSILYSSNGGGKTTRGSLPWLFSLAASEPEKAILVLDNKDGEIAVQTAAMLASMGRKVAVIDDLGVHERDGWDALKLYMVTLNALSAAIAIYKRDPRDLIFAIETITHALIAEPNNDAKNKYWRAWARNLIEFAIRALLKRDADLTTPGAVAALLADTDMLISFAEIEKEEGDPVLQSLSQGILGMRSHEHWPQHLEEAQRAVRLFSPGTRLFEAGRPYDEAAALTGTAPQNKAPLKSHEDLIRKGYIIFLVGPQANMARLGSYYTLHIMGFCSALYRGAGSLRIIGDEFTNAPLKSLISSLTTLRAYGGEFHGICQSRSEIIRKFGKDETATLEENCITKIWYGFSSFEEAERISKAMGDEFSVQSTLGSDSLSSKTQSNLSLGKQRVLTSAELMAMPSDQALVHIKGVGFFVIHTLSQQNIAPYCHKLAENPLEGGRLKPDPKITFVTPKRRKQKGAAS